MKNLPFVWLCHCLLNAVSGTIWTNTPGNIRKRANDYQWQLCWIIFVKLLLDWLICTPVGLLTETSSPAISCKSCQFQQNTHTKNTKEPASANFICKSSCFILLCRMKDKYQTCVICDFGLSKNYENSVMKTHCGTTNYMYLFVCFTNKASKSLIILVFISDDDNDDAGHQRFKWTTLNTHQLWIFGHLGAVFTNYCNCNRDL